MMMAGTGQNGGREEGERVNMVWWLILCVNLTALWCPANWSNIILSFAWGCFRRWFSSVQFSSSVVSDCLQLHELQHTRPPCTSPTPGVFSIHVHWVSDAIQLSHLLSSPSPPAFNLSQHQGLFQWVSSLHQMAKVLELPPSTSVLPMNIQDWFF